MSPTKSSSPWCDVCYVDCCNTGRSFPVSSSLDLEKITCICQSSTNSFWAQIGLRSPLSSGFLLFS